MKKVMVLSFIVVMSIMFSSCGENSQIPSSIKAVTNTAGGLQNSEKQNSEATNASDSSSQSATSESTNDNTVPMSEMKTPWLTDYDAFWTIVEENYPLYAAAERITGNDFAVIKEKYRPQAMQAKNAVELYEILDMCVQEFEGTGHFRLLADTHEYRSYSSLYGRLAKDIPHFAYIYNRLNNPASIAYYKFDPSQEIQKIVESGGNETGTQSSGNLKFEDYPNDKTAYVSIASMTQPYRNNDGKVLAGWFSSLETKGYTDCIIDIRGNGGGNSGYWSEYIVAPNLKGVCSTTNYALVKGSECISYWQVAGLELKSIGTLPIKDLPALLPEDLDGVTHYNSFTMVWEPEGKPLFSGRFWLLVNEDVYSSSEMLAVFCQDTDFATLVGTPTGGDGIGSDPLAFALPNSGICFRFTAELGINADGSCNEEFGTQPNIALKQGEDALEVCLATIRIKK